MQSVVVGFSGGIDSCEAVSRLQKEKFKVIAVTLDMIGDKNLIYEATIKALELGIDHHIIDVKADFKENIIEYFIKEYINGHTPAPCTICNTLIKWRALVDYADKIGAQYVATGHYFRIETINNLHYIKRPKDRSKDQTYYLWGLDQKTLCRILTPMADAIKKEIVESLPHSKRTKESMGVCFLQGNSYRQLIEQFDPKTIFNGDIIDHNGSVVGQHDGTPLYTIGQKKGLNTSTNGCVVDIDATKNQLTIGKREELYHQNLVVTSFNIVSIEELLSSKNISVMIRGIGINPEGFASFYLTDDKLIIKLDNPAWALSPGQPVVFYKEDILLGGGILSKFY